MAGGLLLFRTGRYSSSGMRKKGQRVLAGLNTEIRRLVKQREEETRNLQRNHTTRVMVESIKLGSPNPLSRKRMKRPEQDRLFDPIKQRVLF